jgi:hypothetical protein
MNCGKCQQQLTAAEPVFRLFINLRVNWQMVCGPCETAASKACAFPPLWDLPRCCSQCGRSVFVDSPPRKVRYFVCGAECRQAAHKASYRRMHPTRSPVERQCLCGAAFTPKRNEAKFCSAACKQRAYRARLTTIQRPPGQHHDADRRSAIQTDHWGYGRASGESKVRLSTR